MMQSKTWPIPIQSCHIQHTACNVKSPHRNKTLQVTRQMSATLRRQKRRYPSADSPKDMWARIHETIWNIIKLIPRHTAMDFSTVHTWTLKRCLFFPSRQKTWRRKMQQVRDRKHDAKMTKKQRRSDKHQHQNCLLCCSFELRLKIAPTRKKYVFCGV